MLHTLTVLFGDTPCRITTDNGNQARLLLTAFEPFIVQTDNPHQLFEIQTYSSHGIPRITCEQNTQKTTIVISKQATIKEISDSIKQGFGTFLPTDDGIVLHASCVEIDGVARIFVGRSGMGKSTISQLAPQGIIRGDDSAVIQRINSSYELFPSPFHERNPTIKTHNHMPIKGIYIIHQSAINKIIRAKDPIEAFRHAWQINTHPLDHANQNSSMHSYWPVALNIASQVPVYDVWFTKKPDIWKLLV